MTYALIALTAVVVVQLYLLHRKDDTIQRLLRGHHEERKELLNRIQAPQQVVAETMTEDRPNPPSIPYDDDQAHQKFERERHLREVK